VATDKHSFRLQPLFNSTGSKLFRREVQREAA
jgi:hypothetical protein